MKGNKGITLIALVITIIVLLILAAVSIAMLTGENSILRRGSQASAENQLGAANDAVSILVTETITDFYEKAYVNNNNTILNKGLNAYLASKIDKTAVEKAIDNGDIKVTTPAWDTTNGDTAKEVFVLEITDKRATYKSTGTVANGKVTWKITY